MAANVVTSGSSRKKRGKIRPLSPNDLPQVGALYERVVRSGTSQPPAGLLDDLERMFVASPCIDPQIPSLVYEDSDGLIAGFLGIYVRNMRLGSTSVRMACSGQLVVEESSRSRGVAVFLMRTYLDGPQELSVTDGATATVARLWERLGGQTCHLRCLQWTRTLRPFSRFIQAVGRASPIGKPVAAFGQPFAYLCDSASQPFMPRFKNTPGLTTCELRVSDMVETWDAITTKCPLKMEYGETYLNWLFGELRRIRSRGRLHAQSVNNRLGETLGWFIFFERDRGRATLLQLIAKDGWLDDILNSLFQYTADLGCAAISGRLEPELVEPLRQAGCQLQFGSSRSLIHSRQPEILALLNSRQAILTRLDGEWWTSFHRESYA